MVFENPDLKETSRFAHTQLGLQWLWPRHACKAGSSQEGSSLSFLVGATTYLRRSGFVVWGGVQSAVVRETWWQEWLGAVVAEVSGCLL